MMSLLKSRKFIATALAMAAMILHSATGIDLGADQVEIMALLICAWVVGQGLADAGAGGTTRVG